MAYHYRLETLLTVRKNLEEQCQHKLAHELYVLENHKQYLQDLQDKRISLFETLEKKKQSTMTSAMYKFYGEAISNMNRQIIFQGNAISAQEATVEKVREELAEKMKSRKVVERLREKDYFSYTKELQRKVQVENDEMAVMRFGREERV